MNDSNEGMNLEPLDPAAADPGFWIRFHGRVMARARDELARRQAEAEWGVADVVFRWRKALVPISLLAAALAGIVLLEHEEPAPSLTPVALEQALTESLDGDPIPSVLARTAELDEVAFLNAAGGFRP